MIFFNLSLTLIKTSRSTEWLVFISQQGEKNITRKTNEIIETLQKAVEKHGDLAFKLRDNENGCSFFDVPVFADTAENGGCFDGETPTIGISF